MLVGEQPKLCQLAVKTPSSVARHTAERISSQTIRLIVFGLVSWVIGVDAGLTNIFHSLFLELPNSRTQEHEGTLSSHRVC
jgi:hypothetical protein